MGDLKKIEELTNTLIRVEDNLKEEKEILEFIIDHTTDGYWDWNMKTNYEYLSPKFKSQLGYKVDELEPKPESWQKICNKEDLAAAGELINKYMSGELDEFRCNLRFTHKQGHEIKILCVGKIVKFDEDGSPNRMIGTHRIIK